MTSTLRLYCDDKADDYYDIPLEPGIDEAGDRCLDSAPSCILNFDDGEFDRLTFDLYDTNGRYTASYVVTHKQVVSFETMLQKRPVRSHIGDGPRLHLMVARKPGHQIVIKDIQIASFQKAKRVKKKAKPNAKKGESSSSMGMKDFMLKHVAK